MQFTSPFLEEYNKKKKKAIFVDGRVQRGGDLFATTLSAPVEFRLSAPEKIKITGVTKMNVWVASKIPKSCLENFLKCILHSSLSVIT